jgi:hypothetical protein
MPQAARAGAGIEKMDTIRAPRGSITQRLISLSTQRSDVYRPPRVARFPAAGLTRPDGIGYPQGFSERFLILT